MEICKYLRKFCLNGTIVGLKYFYLYPDILSRCFWCVIMVAVVYLAFLLSSLLHSRFLESPTRITIENQYELVSNLPHPAITLCSPNQLTMSAVRHFNKTLVDGDVSLDLASLMPTLLGFYHNVPDHLEEDMALLQKLIHLNRYSVVDMMASLPQRCSDFLRLCVLYGEVVPCSNLFHPVLTTHGLCCSHNSVYHYKTGKRNEQIPNFIPINVKYGPQIPLSIVTDYNPEDAVDGTIINAAITRVLYTDWTEFPADDESILVQPNTETFHAIQATSTYCSPEVQQLPTWSRKCLLPEEQALPYFGGYHNSDCDHLCLVQAAEQSCGCLVLYLPRLRSERVCNLTSIECLQDVRMNLNNWLQSDKCDCPRDCESRRYRADLIVGNLRAVPYMPTKPYEGMKLNSSTAVMHFYFPTATYVKQKQQIVMSAISLASNLGGVFGLCLGCSVISVLELFFYVYLMFKEHRQRRKGGTLAS